jgi:hypothetical protein
MPHKYRLFYEKKWGGGLRIIRFLLALAVLGEYFNTPLILRFVGGEVAVKHSL